MRRGEPGPIIVVGEGPGRKEQDQRVAFSGMSGRRLDEWLVGCGASKAEPRARVYTTSVLKCMTSSKPSLRIMAANCRPLLERQLSLIRPKLIISLGAIAYESLNLTSLPYSAAVCRPIVSRETVLFSDLGFDYVFLPWPHPSGLNRMNNDPKVKRRLQESFAIVRPFILAEANEA
jgi:uracil-DNA glycosylase family 4